MKIRNRIFSGLFILGITFVGIYVILVKTPTTRLAMELRSATTFIGPTIQNVKEGYFQSVFEEAFSDQFMKRQEILKAYNLLNHELYNVSILDKKEMTLVNIGEDVYTFPGNKGYLTGWPLLKSDKTIEGIQAFTSSVNQLAEQYSDLNFYVYKPFRITESNWFDEDNNFTSYGQFYQELFETSFSNRVLYGDNQINSFEEYQKYYFKTDPHWNIDGSYEGYKKMVELFQVNYPDIQPYESTGKYCLVDFDYYGQYGRNSSYLTEPDEFCDLNFELPEYRTFINGNEGQYDQKEAFMNHTIDEFYWSYIYSVFHGNDEAEVHFKEDQGTGRVLLAFVDSYSSPIKSLIAAHFDEAYFIDPRINQDFDFDTYIVEKGVTDVLYFGFYGSLYVDDSYIFTD